MKKLNEGLLGTADFVYGMRFLRLLTMPWRKTGAFKNGIIDDKGNKLRKPETSQERNSYNTFHKLVFNIRRLLQKIPFVGKSVLTNYAAALFLLKEHTKISEEKMLNVLAEAGYPEIKENAKLICEENNNWYQENVEGVNYIQEGVYTLNEDIDCYDTKRNSVIKVEEHAPVGKIFGLDVYEGFHFKTNKTILITNRNITIK